MTLFLCDDCFKGGEELLIGHMGIWTCESCGKEVDCAKEKWHLVYGYKFTEEDFEPKPGIMTNQYKPMKTITITLTDEELQLLSDIVSKATKTECPELLRVSGLLKTEIST